MTHDRHRQKNFPFTIQHSLVWIALLLSLILRVAIWGQLPRLGMIGDEAEYLAAADWLAHGRGFAWHLQYLWTRAPLYPLFLAAHMALFGRNLTPIFMSQNILGLLNVALVYLIAAQVTRQHQRVAKRAPGIAALLAAIYLPFTSYGQLLLSETLFTSLLLGALVALGAWAQHGGLSRLAGAGVLLGLATLTRGLTLGFLPLITVWVFLTVRGKRRGAQDAGQRDVGWLRDAAKQVCLFTFTFCLVILPWTVYASRAYGGLVIVDTTGAFNLALGARTAYDNGRSDAPLRNFVLTLLDPTLSQAQRHDLLADAKGGSCLFASGDERIMTALNTQVSEISQADRQRLLSAEAFCLLKATPGAFIKKSLIELIDLFQINYTGDERLSKGFSLGRLPPWYSLALFLLDDTLYVLALPLAVLGWALLRSRQQDTSIGLQPAAESLLGLWLIYNLATAPLLFAINRFRVPLMPLVFVLAAYALASWSRWRELRTRYGAACATLAGLLLLVAATPYAYLEPRAPGEASRWASYLGPHPSSLASTQRALATHTGYLAEQQFMAMLGSGDGVVAHEMLLNSALPDYAVAMGEPLLDGLEGRPNLGLDRLATEPVQPLEDWQRSLIAGELFREMGDLEAARRELGPHLVDDANPVEWAWQWLYPPPIAGNRIDLADDNDLGYIRGFYLGRYDTDLDATLRWATGESALRFPQAANAKPQQICMHVSGLGWPQDLALPTISASLGETLLGSFKLTREIQVTCLDLPARPAGSDLIIALHSDTFVADALDLVRQQGPQVGQLRTLAYQLDWAEVR
ncbi:MAG: hypothetical protein HGA19_07075 [Oscillochloris sp.]|nr:hypothetical protein [Oscillochloris sp.]